MARRSRGQRRRHAVQQRKQSECRRAETDDTQPPPKLMTLPAELRNRIWAYVFEGSIQELHGNGYAISGMHGNWKYSSSPPPILSTCKQIYTEAVGIYYSSTTFVSKIKARKESAEQFMTWMKNIGVERASLIKNVRFTVSEVYEHLRQLETPAAWEWHHIDAVDELLEAIKEAAASVHSGGLCVYANLSYHDREKGFEIWTSNPWKTNQDARRAYEQASWTRSE